MVGELGWSWGSQNLYKDADLTRLSVASLSQGRLQGRTARPGPFVAQQRSCFRITEVQVLVGRGPIHTVRMDRRGRPSPHELCTKLCTSSKGGEKWDIRVLISKRVEALLAR